MARVREEVDEKELSVGPSVEEVPDEGGTDEARRTGDHHTHDDVLQVSSRVGRGAGTTPGLDDSREYPNRDTGLGNVAGAVDTSTPPSTIHFHVAHVPDRAREYVMAALDENVNVNGRFTRACAERLQSMYGIEHVLVTHSATGALEMAAMLLAVEHGATRAYMPSYTFSSTANAFLRAGFEIEFVDIDPATMNAGIAEFAAADPEAGSVIVPVHYAGNPGEIDRVADWASEHRLHVVEDAAQALGSRIGTQSAGTFGALAAISFHFTKNVHSSLGGALFVNDPGLIERATYIWERGTNRQALLKGLVDRYSWVEIGSSFQLSEMQAALLLAGLEEYDDVVSRRGDLWDVYSRRLGGLDQAGVHVQSWRSDVVNNHHAFFVRLENADLADRIRLELREAGIAAYIGYVPLHDAPYGVRAGLDRSLPSTERWASTVLRLPLHTAMTVEDAERVADTIVRSVGGA